MRVISGFHKGRKLKMKGGRIRPTSNKVRQAVFNILAQNMEGKKVLDLFAGTGAMGLEALSRGAFLAVFVDSGREAGKVIKENIAMLDLADKAQLMPKKAMAAIKLLAADQKSFDLVFIDPPYKSEEGEKLMERISESGVLEKEAIVVVEHDQARKLSEQYGELVRYDRREYGGTAVSFYRWR